MLFIFISIFTNFILIYKYQKSIYFALKKKKEYKTSIKYTIELADFIDNIIVYLKSGKSIYESLQKTFKITNNEQIKKSCLDTFYHFHIGHSLSESLLHSSQCTPHPEYKRLVESIIVSIQYGTPLNENLSLVALQLKESINNDLQIIANKAPIKMIFPLVFLIFPVIFILLGCTAIEDLFVSLSTD